MNLKEFINSHNVEYSNNCIDNSEIPNLESLMSVTFGEQLKEYLLNYGYLGYEFVELFGINKKAMDRSDMVKETQYLHSWFPITENLIAIEDQGDGDYCLVDKDDSVYHYFSSINALTKTTLKLFEYILERFDFVNKIYKDAQKDRITVKSEEVKFINEENLAELDIKCYDNKKNADGLNSDK